MKQNRKADAGNIGPKTLNSATRQKAFSIPRLSQNEDLPQSLRIYEVTKPADHWRIMDHARILPLQIDCRRYRDQLAAFARIASGGKNDD